MGDKFPEFMHTDLTKLTWTGWLLLLTTLGVVLLAALGLGLLLVVVFGVQLGQGNKWVMAVVLILALALGGGVFQLGKYLLARAGFPILRSE
jgi:hypothetical protein